MWPFKKKLKNPEVQLIFDTIIHLHKSDRFHALDSDGKITAYGCAVALSLGLDTLVDDARQDRRKYLEQDNKISSLVDQILTEMEKLVDENIRLKAGDFTKEEIHNFCHNLHGTVNAREFCDGCIAEQRKLYGVALDADVLEFISKQRLSNEPIKDSGLKPVQLNRDEIIQMVRNSR